MNAPTPTPTPDAVAPSLATPEGAAALLLAALEATAAAPTPERYDGNARTAAHRVAGTCRNLVARATTGDGAARYAPGLLRDALAAHGWRVHDDGPSSAPELRDELGRDRLALRRSLAAALRGYNARAYEAGRNAARVLARLHADAEAREARAEAAGPEAAAEAAAAAAAARARAVAALARRADAYADRLERLLLAGRRRDALALVEAEGPRLLGLARQLGADPVALGLE